MNLCRVVEYVLKIKNGEMLKQANTLKKLAEGMQK